MRQLVVVGRPDASWCQEKSSKPLDGNKTFEPLNGTMTGTMISALRPAKKPNLLYPTNQQTQHPQIDPDHFTSQNTKEHENTNFFDNPLTVRLYPLNPRYEFRVDSTRLQVYTRDLSHMVG